jgi:hypothetical protein
VTIYYWWQNIKGIEESSDKALRVMQITTVMVIMLLAWGCYSRCHPWCLLPAGSHPLHFSISAMTRSVS